MAEPARPQRVVVITGASSGIGRATAVAFAARGAAVVLAARDDAGLAAAAAECRRAGGTALTVPTDVAHEADLTALANRAHRAFGGIDAWVNAAAVMAYGEFEDVPSEVYRQVLETNLHGQIHAARAVLPHFRRQGTGVLVNLSSVWGAVSSPYVSAYVVSKFGVRAFSESLREAMRLHPATRDIHVCTILPQSVDTPIFQHAANYTGRETKPVPPVINPHRVARAIVRTVEHPRRQRTVGHWGRLLELAHEVAPGLFTRLAPTAMNLAALGRTPTTSNTGNLFHPVPEHNTTHGHWRNAPLRLALTTAAGAALTAAIALTARSRRDRTRATGSGAASLAR